MSGGDVTLDALGAVVGAQVVGDSGVPVTGVRHDSREVVPGDLFVAVPGYQRDGRSFVQDAMRRGASAVALDRSGGAEALNGAPGLLVASPRRALSALAHEVYGQPSGALRVSGVTGTNGKTTTVALLRAMHEAAGFATVSIGTLWGGGATHTTPEADVLHRHLRNCVSDGVQRVAMEVSSHGLALHRVDHVRFEVAAFLNLSQDHLDFHGTMDAYFAAKRRLFMELQPARAVVCVDDGYGETLARDLKGQSRTVWSCASTDVPGAHVRVGHVGYGNTGMDVRLHTPGGELSFHTPLMGRHNLQNLVVAVAVGLCSGLSEGSLVQALGAFEGASGRLERVESHGGARFFVDYAHTPDALDHVLSAVRASTRGRLWVVFGCGGDRDVTKRPSMGEVAANRADMVLVTDDNPRSEPSEAILADVLKGLDGFPSVDLGNLAMAPRGKLAIGDRRRAITAAVRAAAPDDTVVVAGKGHETYQLVGARRLPFDDRQVIREALRSLREPTGRGDG